MEKQSFWDRYARRYSHFVRADQEAYAQMLEWIRPSVTAPCWSWQQGRA